MIHLAVQAAFRVCRDVVRHQNPSRDWMDLIIRPEMLAKFLSHYAKIANFLKHAERNPTATLDISKIHVLNEHNIFVVCVYYWDAFPEARDPIMWTFAGWYGKKHFDLCSAEPSGNIVAFAPFSQQEVWSMLQTACDMTANETAQMAASSPGFDW